MALSVLALVCAAGPQPHHLAQPVTVEALTLAKARQIAQRRLGWRFRQGLAWCATCWTLRHQSG